MSNSTLYKGHYTQNREISWLRFNDRVLNEAKDPSVPLLERLKFVSIYTSNLEEFFMIRVGSINALKNVNEVVDSRSGLTPTQQLDKIYDLVKDSFEKRDKIFNSIIKKLKDNDIILTQFDDLNKDQKKYSKKYFKDNIRPFLRAQIVDSHHPFPVIESGVLHIICDLTIKEKAYQGIIPISKSLPSIVPVPTKNKNRFRFITMEELVRHCVDNLFKDAKVEKTSSLQITRNGDVNPDDEIFDDIIDYRKKVKKVLGERRRMETVRLIVSKDMTAKCKRSLINRLKLHNKQVYVTSIPLDVSFGFSLPGLINNIDISDLLYKPYKPKLSTSLDYTKPLFDQILEKDVIFHYPYESMDAFVQLIKEAADDKDVMSIKITIYRLAKNAALVEHLCRAAENGKDVVVLIELKARFDEQSNIDYSERLEYAGCTILYGFEDYKVHSKICQITRKKGNKAEVITNIATGNYNENSAKLYTDYSYITANKKIAKDGQDFFNNMMIGKLDGKYSHLWIAPVSLKQNLSNAIKEEIKKGKDGLIMIKINSIADSDIITLLHEASMAGVEIKLIVRGICCLLPKIEGKTENIEVRCIVGRYLEHSRIYIFGRGKDQKVFISSADLMARNTEKRVEIATPIYDANIKNQIIDFFNGCLKDNTKARIMSKHGAYLKIKDGQEPFSIQDYMMETTKEASLPEKENRGKVIASFKTKL